MRLKAFALAAVLCAPIHAAVESTIDEWADRFLPEGTKKPEVPSYADDFDRAAADVSAGRYRAALCALVAIKKVDAARSDMIRARALIGLGEIDDGLKVLAGPALANDAAPKILAAQTLLNQNRLADAQKIIDALLTTDDSNPAVHVLKGQLLEAQGDFPKAIETYNWFNNGPTPYLQKWQADPSQFESADDIVAFATGIHRWATLTSAYKDVPQLNDTVLNMFVRAYDVVDRDNITARVAAAQFALSRGDTKLAGELIEQLEKSAPLNHDVLSLFLSATAGTGDFTSIQKAVDKMRYVDPNSFDADAAEIQGLIHARRVAAGERAALLYAAHPNDLTALGLHAACAYVNGNGTDLDPLMKQADQLSPHRSDAQVTAATLLEALNQRDTAVGLLKTAIARTPWEATPRHLLGSLYLNDGYNDQAQAVLDEAYALDPYNLKTVNYLRLLKELSQYGQRTSDHLIVFYDKDADPLAADQIGSFMDRTYDDLVKIFKYTPQTKIVVQIYPNDDEFSVRMAGVPGVENFGVSFGRVLATIAPREGTKQGNFNWARVLRHEFVHTFNEMATENRCPRWLTEGLAVWQEGVPFRFDGVPREMYKRTMAGELFTFRQFPLAFIQPRRPGDGEQAYTQSAWLAKYLAQKYGPDSIVKILAGYGEAKSDEEAFLGGTGDPIAKIQADWFAWMKQQLTPWNYDEESNKKVEALEKEGESLLKAKQFAEALKDWQEACDIQPTEVKPHQRLAYLYLQKDLADPAKAIEHLKFLHTLELTNNRYAKTISRQYTKLGDAQNAIEWARQATYVDLYDASAHEMLADLYTQAGDETSAAKEREAVEQIKLWQQKRQQEKDGPADNGN